MPLMLPSQSGYGRPMTGPQMSNPYETQIREWMAALPTLAPLAQQFQSAAESYAPKTGQWADPMLQQSIPQLMQGGMSPTEEAAARQNIASSYRSAVGAGGFAGGSAGAFSPQAVRRVAYREAGNRLAPAMAQLEAKKAEMRRSGLQAGVGALTSLYPSQMQQASAQGQEYGQLLGNLLGGASAQIKRGPRNSLTYLSPWTRTKPTTYVQGGYIPTPLHPSYYR